MPDEPEMPDASHPLEAERGRLITRRLNEAFYATSPTTYFEAQIRQVMRLGDELAASVVPPPVAGEFTRDVLQRMPGWESAPEDDDDHAAQRVLLTIETFMLVHHIGETLLRGYLAHFDAGDDGSTWYALHHVRGNKRIRELREAWRLHSFREDIEWAFCPIQTPDAKAEREAWLDYVSMWLTKFAEYLTDTEFAYNAAKHGLGTIAGPQQVSFSREQPRAGASPGVVLLDGDAIESLEQDKEKDLMMRATRAVDTAGLVAMALVANHLIGQLWEVGRARHLGGTFRMSNIDSPTLIDVKRPKPLAWSIWRSPINWLGLDAGKVAGEGDQATGE